MSLLEKAASKLAKHANAETVEAGLEAAAGLVDSAIEFVETAPERLENLEQTLEDHSFARITKQLNKAFGVGSGNNADDADGRFGAATSHRLIVRANVDRDRKLSDKFLNCAEYRIQNGNGDYVLLIEERRLSNIVELIFLDGNGAKIGRLARTHAIMGSLRSYTVEMYNSYSFEIIRRAPFEKMEPYGSHDQKYAVKFASTYKGWQYGYFKFPQMRDDEIREPSGKVIARLHRVFGVDMCAWGIDYANLADGLPCAMFALVDCLETMSEHRQRERNDHAH